MKECYSNSSSTKDLSISLKYAVTDTISNQRNFLVGLATVMIVVTFVTLLQNAVISSSAVFVRLSEQQVGEMDLVFLPDSRRMMSDAPRSVLLNETYMRDHISGVPNFLGNAKATKKVLVVSLTFPKERRLAGLHLAEYWGRQLMLLSLYWWRTLKGRRILDLVEVGTSVLCSQMSVMYQRHCSVLSE